MRLHILPKLPGVTLAELERRPSMVQQFFAGLPMGSDGASQVTITLAAAVFNAAVDDQLIGRSPYKAQSVRMPRQGRGKGNRAADLRRSGLRPVAVPD